MFKWAWMWSNDYVKCFQPKSDLLLPNTDKINNIKWIVRNNRETRDSADNTEE